MNGHTVINKGNYEMDTEERLEQFNANRALGWENAYYEYRKNWSEYPKDQHVSEYPLQVDIELSTVCNLRCPMCFRAEAKFKNKVSTQLMSMELFTKIVDEIAGKVPAVRLSLRGESTLHPEFISCIRYCKSKGIKEVSFLTNVSKLSEEYFIQIAEAGADWITISIDGVGKEYENIRKPLKFEDTLRKIKDIHKIKEERGWKKPVIKIQGVWPAIRENPSEYYNTFAPYVDLVAFNPILDYSIEEKDIIYEDYVICPQQYQRLIIGSDGNALLCTNDENGKYILGDANNESVYNLWHGDRINRVRELQKRGAFKDVEICRTCFIQRATEESEHAFVNDREIIIKNYIHK